MKKMSLALTLAMLMTACTRKIHPGDQPASPYAFHFLESEQLMPVLAQAKAENKLVFVDFYTEWCLPCRLMEEEVFTDRGLAGYINERFISYRVDAEKGNGVNLSAIFEIKAYPTLLFLDAGGRVLVRREGAVSQSAFRQLAEEAILEIEN